MKRMIMFVTYDFSDVSSGSKVRPMKMYNAFKNIGYDVFLISGNREEKNKIYKDLKNEDMNFDFCYIEPSTYPMQPLIDHMIIKYIRSKKIPIGIFYRDAYWKFYKNFLYKGYKNFELKIRYELDLLFFKKVSNTMFFPSDEMAKYFLFKQPKVALPPAADKRVLPKKNKKVKKIPTAIYVGGVSKRYGTELLLKSFENVNELELKVKLLLICRKEEYDKNIKFFSNYIGKEWLEIKHVNGKLLEKEYDKADFGVIPILKDTYNDFAVPVKLFEYLSFGLPIMSTNCKVLEKYIMENKLGIVRDSNFQSFSDGINTMIYQYVDFIDSIKSFVNEFGRWEHRAKRVETILLK